MSEKKVVIFDTEANRENTYNFHAFVKDYLQLASPIPIMRMYCKGAQIPTQCYAAIKDLPFLGGDIRIFHNGDWTKSSDWTISYSNMFKIIRSWKLLHHIVKAKATKAAILCNEIYPMEDAQLVRLKTFCETITDYRGLHQGYSPAVYFAATCVDFDTTTSFKNPTTGKEYFTLSVRLLRWLQHDDPDDMANIIWPGRLELPIAMEVYPVIQDKITLGSTIWFRAYPKYYRDAAGKLSLSFKGVRISHYTKDGIRKLY